jgi:putative glutamine amidotransferase
MGNRTVVVSAGTRLDDGTVRVRLNTAYVAALESAGLVPVIIPPLSDPARAGDVLAAADGLLLSGGGDVNPGLYGESLHPNANPPDDDRDATEIALVTKARAEGIPTLAICRGIQTVNVALGGSLLQDIPSQLDTDILHDAREGRKSRTHEVILEPGSRLSVAAGATRITVNSLHHQAVARLAPGLRATGHAPDGIIEGIESDGEWWMIGVQWHPEEMLEAEDPWDRGLFCSFAAAVRARTS